MIFAETWFLWFVLITVPTIWILPASLRRVALLTACAIFHGHYAGPAGMTPIIILAGITYFALNTNPKARLLAIAVTIAALLHYKYTGYFNQLFATSFTASVAPLAISFFVFEFVHILTDRHQKKLKGEVKLLDFSIFTIFFPSLASGPIKRYQQFTPELERLGRPDYTLLTQSLVRILLGYFKKFCIADALARDLPPPDRLDIWHAGFLTLSVLQGIRIFADFSGYSDIAIGLAGLFNIRLPENFSFPYLARNIQEFWRRWHISLSTWIRDYIYIVLGGNRVASWRRFSNLLLAFVLCGLWHGAATHFVLWGLLHGGALVFLHFWKMHVRFKVPAPVAWAFTFVFVQLTWLAFFYDIDSVWKLIQKGPIL